MKREEFLNKVATLTEAAKAYYTTDSLKMSDAEYDALLTQVEQAAEENNWDDAEALLNAVAAGTVQAEGNITHVKPMLSMAKTKDLTGVLTFVNKIPEADVSIEPKLDGLAVSFIYENGNLVQAVTRGDGIKGDSIFEQVISKTILNLPHRLDENINLNVRGELYITHENFEKAQIERTALGKTAFANPRNAVAGSVKNETDNYVIMSFSVYDTVGFEASSYLEELQHLTRLGFQTANSLMPENLGETVEEVVTNFGSARTGLDFPVDGIVTKANSLSVRENLGVNAKSPNWALAYKYEDEQKTTKLLNIERAVGRTGAISFTAIFEPIELEGTVVQKATLNNAKYIEDNNIRIGGNIVVFKANQIIPCVACGIDNDEAPKYEASTTCPNCSQPLDTTSSIVWRCLSPECSILQTLVFFTGRDFMDIEGLSEAALAKLLESGLVSDQADLYALTVEQLANLKMNSNKNSEQDFQLLGVKTATKLFEEIQKSKTADFNRVISSLNIRHLGRRLGKRLALRFPTMAKLQNASIEELMEVEGIAKDKAETIYNGLKTQAPLIAKLAAAGVNMGSDENITSTVSTVPEGLEWVQGSTFVITGSIEGMNRTQVQEALEGLGGVAQSSVSSRTNYLIVGANAGSKLAKAQSLGINVKEASEVINLLTEK